jgi:hypothetical protein
VFVTGYFNSPAIAFGSTTLTNFGNTNAFIAKYGANGNVLWAKSAGGNVIDEGQSTSTDGNGNVFITGYFSSPTITFGSILLTNAGNDNVFIAKYDSLGNVIWAKSAGGSSIDEGQSISTDGNGNVYVSGWFSSPTIAFGSTILTSGEMFIGKLSSTTGINEVELDNSILIYPNPTSGKLTIQNKNLRLTNIEIEIFNVIGENIYKSQSSSQQFIIDISSEPSGVYFLKIISQDGSLAVKKIIKE